MRAPNVKTPMALMALIAVTAAGCGGGGSTKSSTSGSGASSGSSATTASTGSGKSYKVGVILPLTGPAGSIGIDFQTALNVFKSIDQEAKAVTINYTVCDDKTTPDGAAACARQLIQQDNVNMIYGPIIAGTFEGARPVLLTGPPTVTPSPYVTAGAGQPIFSASGNAMDLDTTTLTFAKTHGFQRVAVLATTDTTGETAVSDIKKANATLGLDVSVERMGATDVDASAQLNRLLQKKPQYIYVAASGAAVGVALKGLKQLGADIPTALIWSNTTNGFLKAAAPVFPTQTLFAVSPSWLPSTLNDPALAARIAAFQDAFKAASGQPVSFVVQGAYDAFQLIASSLAAVGGNKADLLNHLQSLHDFQGLDWKLSYSNDNHNGSASGNYVMARYNAGTWSPAAS